MKNVILANLQHAENCVNTSVFARPGPNKHKYLDCFQKENKHRKYRGFGLPRRQKHRYLRCFCSESVKKCKNATYVTIFEGPQKCENKMCCKNNKNNNKSGLEQFGNCEAAQKLKSGTLIYVVCHRGKAPLAALNLSTHCHVRFNSFLCM